jgi:diguanylate cyclase (GGDEF)-like protein
LTPLPTAARADSLAPPADVRIQSRLLRLQVAAIVLALSLSACVLACQAVRLPAALLDVCPGNGPAALLFALTALGLGLLHPEAPGPATLAARHRCATAIGLGLIATGLLPWLGAWWALLTGEGVGALSRLSAGLPQGHLGAAADGVGPLVGTFAVAAGAFLCVRTPRLDARVGAGGCALAMVLLGIALLSVSSSGLGVPLPGMADPDGTPWTLLLVMACLGIASVSECARHPGPLSVLTSTGMGGRRVRRLLPVVLLPGVFLVGVALAVTQGIASLPVAVASAFTVTSLGALLLLLGEGRHMDRFEAGLRLVSLLDELTHIYNRRGFMLLGERSFQTARRQGLPLSVLYFDLDNLKPVNDAFGHATGSRMLREFAEILNQHCRASDVVARVGGDEFAVVSTATGETLERQLQRIAAAVSERNRHGQRPYRIRYSVGQASCDPARSAGFEDLVSQADARMYEHKLARRREHGLATDHGRPGELLLERPRS